MFRLLLAFVLLLSFSLTQAESLDKIVAVVNDEVITQSQLDQATDQLSKQMVQSNMPALNASLMREEALNQLINQSLQLQLAQKAKIKVSDEELQKAISSIAAQNHLSTQEFKAKISSETGLSAAQFGQQIRQQILISKLQQMALGPKININESDVNKAVQKAQQHAEDFTEYDISDILIPLPDNPSATQLNEAKKRATELVMQLKRGKSVEKLITAVKPESKMTQKKESSPLFGNFFSKLFHKQATAETSSVAESNPQPDQVSVDNLGWRKKSDLPEVFAAQINALKRTKIAGPIQTANGLHLLYLNGIRIPPEQMVDRNQIRNQLYQEAMMKQLPDWIKTIRQTAYIKINP